MDILRKSVLFGLLVLAVAWPLQPQRTDRPQRDRERKLKLPATEEHAPAGAPAQWAKHYDSICATSIQQTTDGGYVLAGYTGYVDYGFKWMHVRLLKLDSQGGVEWSTYLEEDVYWGGHNRPTDIAQTPDGGFVVGGGGGNWVVKLDAAGVIEWQKEYSHGYQETASSLHLTQDGGFIIGGRQFGALVMKLRSNGEVEWEKRYEQGGSSQSLVAEDVVQTPDEGYIMVGATSFFINGVADLLVLKLDPVGEVEWQKRYAGTGDERIYSVQPLADGSYIVAGATAYSDQYQRDALAMKLTPGGEIVWCKAYTGFPAYHGGASEIRQTPVGGFIMACEGAILRLDAQGNIVWQRDYKDFFTYAVKPTADGGFIFAGNYDPDDYESMVAIESDSPEMFAYYGDIAVFKTDSQGIIAGCHLLRDPGITVRSKAVTPVVGPLTAVPLSGALADYDFVPRQQAVIAQTICLPYFELTIAAGPGGTTKPEPATHVYAGGSSVKVYALPDERHVFSYWSGDVPENKRHDNPVRIDMDDNKSIQAYFARPNFQLTISAGSGGTTDPTPGVHTYVGDTVVNVTALPDASHYFTFWTGDVPDEQRGQNPALIEMDSDKTVAASFLARIYPPLDLRVETKENRSLFQVEYINILTWRPNPNNVGILKYRVYELRGGNLVLLAEPAVETETYQHRGVEKGKTYIYVVKAVGNDGREGEPATVTITVS